MKKTYKLIALDVDGTILDGHYRVAGETKRVLQQAMVRGVMVTLATGRAYPSALAVAREIGVNAPLVTHDGAYVVDSETGRVLYEERIDPALVLAAVELLQPLGVNINLIHQEHAITNQRFRNFQWSLLQPANWPALLNLLRENQIYRPLYVGDMAAYLKRNPTVVPKLYITGRPEAIRQGRRLIESELKGALRCTPAGPGAMEVTHQETSKASGLRVLAADLGIGMEEILACGDSHNDLEMLSQVGMGVAMGNAPADVQRVARFVTRTNREHGVAHAVRQFVLN